MRMIGNETIEQAAYEVMCKAAIDFGGTLTEFNSALSGPQADRYAIAQDWQAVGDDLRNAMGVYEFTIEVEEPANADRP